jgi:translation initiation factor 4A
LHGNIIPFHLAAIMAGVAPEGSQFDAKQFDSKMNEL